MKYSIALVAFILLFVYAPYNVLAQDKKDRFPLSDAIKFVGGDNQLKSKILKAYDADINVWENNKFVDVTGIDFISLTRNEVLEINDAQSGASGNPLGAPLIDALGTVIAKRFKEELTLAFLDNFREKLKNEKYLGALFPNARLILLYDDPFNHKVWLTSFRGALDKDLRAIPDNMPNLLNEIKVKSNLNEKQTQLLEALIAVYSPVAKVFKNPEDSYLSAVSLLENLSGINKENKNLSSGLMLMRVLIKEMGNSKYDNWADDLALSKLKNFNVAKVFIGLTIEKYKEAFEGESVKIENGSSLKLYQFLNSDHLKSINPISSYITSTIQHVEVISEKLNDLKSLKETRSEEGKKLMYSDFLPLINQSTESLGALLDDTTLRNIGLRIEGVNKIPELLSKVNASTQFIKIIKENIDSKDYSKLVVSALAFISENIPEDKLESSAALKEFAKYASFAVNLAGAETSEEMTAAIESSILPVQSYRLKRNNAFSISVNSYAGVFAAKEFLLNDDAKNETSSLIGFTAPIGVGFNFGFNKPKIENGVIVKNNKKLISSLSIYASIIDVGAITTYRLTNDETPVDGIQWQNIFAPGAYLVFGIHNTPLALSIGGQYGPELRSVTAVEGVATPTIDSRAFRFGMSLTVDIPFFHLYSKK